MDKDKHSRREFRAKNIFVACGFCVCIILFLGLMSLSAEYKVTYDVELPQRLSMPLGYLPDS